MVLVLFEEITDQGEASDSGNRYYAKKQLQESHARYSGQRTAVHK